MGTAFPGLGFLLCWEDPNPNPDLSLHQPLHQTFIPLHLIASEPGSTCQFLPKTSKLSLTIVVGGLWYLCAYSGILESTHVEPLKICSWRLTFSFLGPKGLEIYESSSVKGQIVNIFSSVGHLVSTATT